MARVEGGEGIVVAHEHAKAEVSRHGEESACDANRDEIVHVLYQIHDILHGCEAERDKDSVDDAVGIFVIVFVFAKQKPQHE